MPANDAGLPSESPVTDPAQGAGGQSGFSPFASIGTVVQVPAAQPPRPQGGDWSASALVTLVGIACIASLLRKLVA